ncbi:gibberellin-regulated protein 4 [Phtheirospermum japonicum]|uniref:Gibberellin-regulated protein 4 n=1 Tax=Phtheirospermum japonicum TaxID=374723 RepID=A0A830CPF3_9LAMI|nr:gibberellin-regulated protein 4 [Phtheirospermum japonicum]
MQGDKVQEALFVLLQQVLQQVPLRSPGVLWEQSRLLLLQQLEDQGRRTKMPLIVISCFFILFSKV